MWVTTAALVELWRTRHAITAVPGLGPRPTDPGDAAAFDDLDARVRALTGRRRPVLLPPPDAPASVMIAAALGHLDAPPPGGPLPDHPALRDPFGVAPCPTAHSTRASRGAPWLPSSPANGCRKRGWRRSLPPATTTRTNSAPAPAC
ncbi:hypothetical protein ABZX74_34815 [Streptomyces olivaceoviridis]|uniref:hypothetical protein n=1 Tax=Streptomyces olivaceoviridis TaxID=1921 RepID=UPI0033B6B933